MRNVLTLTQKSEILMARMSYKRKKSLPKTEYACPRDRKLPINDAAHVRNAMARFNQVESRFCHPATARRRILAAAKKFGVDVGDFKKVKSFESTRKEG
jgi:hypothetical protein